MQEKELKTSWKQRVIIMIIAVLIMGSFLATYVIFVFSNSKNNKTDTSSTADTSKTTEIEERYQAKNTELSDYATANLSGKYLDTLAQYRTEVKAYNSTTANSEGLKVRDLKTGDGKELAEGDTDYLAYYIGWCADESIFDSSFNDASNPTALKNPSSGNVGLIEGWNKGVVGMKLGGVRELTIPGELAYKDTQEICGGTNSPLKFIVLTFSDSEYSKKEEELNSIYQELIQAYSTN